MFGTGFCFCPSPLLELRFYALKGIFVGKNSNISWTDHTWNPWQGCHKVSNGCKNCYMFRDKKRYGQEASVVVRSKPATFNKPLLWDEPAKVFVCSWSDFFIEEADEWRQDAWDIIEATPHLTYLLLTKRPENIKGRLLAMSGWFAVPDNVWLGVTVENSNAKERIDILRGYHTPVNFLSIEPLIGDIGRLNLMGVDWVIVGAESGPKRRPCKIEWIRDIVRQCKEASVPVFVKQMEINGKITADPKDWPEDLRIQEFPL